MTHEEMLNEAIRLGDEDNYADALSLWKTLANLPGLDLENKCVFLLNQRRCYSALGQHERAEDTLRELERLDTSRHFWVEVELARFDELRSQGKFSEAHKKLVRFQKENADLLASARYADVVYEANLTTAYYLINQNQPAEGLQTLDKVMAVLEDNDKREVLYYRGLAHYKLDQWDASLDEFKQILDCGSDDAWSADSHYVFGLVYEHKGAFAWAKQHLQRAENLKSLLRVPLTDVYIALSNVCARLGELEEAKSYRDLSTSQNC